MNNLLTINYDSGQPTISARELHKVLGIEKRFSAWFETNSSGFIKNEDFTSVLTSTVVNNGAERDLKDYKLTTDMAKHIALMSRTPKGKECRQQLIDLEKAWNTPDQVMARALKMADDKIHSLQLDVSRMKPLAEFGKALAKSETSILIRELAKIITQATGINIGERRLYTWLRENKYIMQNSTEPYQNRVEQGLFERNANGTRTNSEGVTKTNYTTYVTPKGQAYFINKFKKEDKHNG